jgi:prohibitin 2
LQTHLKENLAKNDILLEDVFITDFKFSDSFDKAIESKVTAEQRALESKNKLEQVKFEAEQQIATAKAEAESIRIKAQAVTQQGGADYVKLQAIQKWDGKLPVADDTWLGCAIY